MNRLIALNEVAEINPRFPRALARETQRIVSFVPMSAVSEDGRLSEFIEKPLGEVSSGFTYFERGDTLLAKITPCMENGKAAHVSNLPHHIGFGSTEFHVLRPGPEIDGRYLFYMVWNPLFRFEAKHKMTGAAGQQRVPTDFLKSYKIPLPPLDEQHRIAAILDKADAIRQKQQQSIRLTEEFLRSTFLELFGDSVTNPKGWKIKLLSKVCDVRDGTHDSPQYVINGYPLITSKNLRNGFIDFSEVNLISEEDFIQINKRSAVDQGDIIMPMIGTIGNPVLVEGNEKFAIKNVALIKFSDASINSRYLLNLLKTNYFDYLISRINRGGTQKFIALNDIRNFPIPIPDDSTQQKFLIISQKIKYFNENNVAATIRSDNLFNVLVQLAFRGELS